MRQIKWIALFWLTLPAMAQAANIYCKKPATTIEKAVCQSEALSLADLSLSKTFKLARNNYSADNRKSLVIGQREWLKLRASACITKLHPIEGDELQKCLLSVYRERQSELKQLLEIQGIYKNLGIGSPADIEKILDNKLPDSNSCNEGMLLGGSYAEEEKWCPQTCRELFTLAAGIWDYGGDGIGMMERVEAFDTCAFQIYSAQNVATKSNQKHVVPFDDPTQFSIEFKCLGSNAPCELVEEAIDDATSFPGAATKVPHKGKKKQGRGSVKKENAISFEQAASLGKIKISHNAALAWSIDPDSFSNDTLIITSKNSYSFNGMNYSYKLSPVGDYTGKGRQEVLMNVGYYASHGSMKGGDLLVVYYDSETKSIRPEMISRKSRLRLLTDEQSGQDRN